MEIDTPTDVAPHETRVCRLPRGWLGTGNSLCPRCDRYVAADSLQGHNYGHDVADARLRGEALLTPPRMIAAGNHRENITKEETR